MPRVAARLAPLALLALLALAPTVFAGEPADPCSQYGVFVQLGLDNQYTCAGPCENSGVVAVVGLTGDYDCAGCTDRGVFVFTGSSACGNRFVRACVDEHCVGPNAATPPCGVVTDPVCWSLRLLGYYGCVPYPNAHGRPVCG